MSEASVFLAAVIIGTLVALAVPGVERGFSSAIGMTLEQAEARAISKWNTRAERTCHIEVKHSDSDYTDEPHWKCSECGALIPVYECDGNKPIDYAKYCPNCGAKVVDDA